MLSTIPLQKNFGVPEQHFAIADTRSLAKSFVVPEQHFAIADKWFVLYACNWLFQNSDEENRSSDTYDKVRQQAMYLENDFDMRTHVSFLLRCVGAKWKQ